MKFRPCIDIHKGKVKQIVGGSLSDSDNEVKENFISEKRASYYGGLYKKEGLKGGHVIMLTPSYSDYYEDTKKEALDALHSYADGLQIGGGINILNAHEYLNEGASHVIITSWFFENGNVRYDRIRELAKAIGKERIVIDLSCRYKEDGYYIVTNRWQQFTKERITPELLGELADYCDEFLVHGVDVEGKGSGMEKPLVRLLSNYDKTPVTYAGGISSEADIKEFGILCSDKLDFTIGSALDIFGGKLPFDVVKQYINNV